VTFVTQRAGTRIDGALMLVGTYFSACFGSWARGSIIMENCFSRFGGSEMKRFAAIAVVAFALIPASAPLLAHHGEANYDTDKVVSVKGTVTDFQFINPHTPISLDAKNDKGEIERWSCEARSPGMLVRVGGWDKTTLKPGDIITVFGYRARNGSPVMRLQKLRLADGTVKDNL
jgi:hypothetical protein